MLTFTTEYIPQNSVAAACSLCLIMLFGFSQFSFLICPQECDLWWPWLAIWGILHTWRIFNRAMVPFLSGTLCLIMPNLQHLDTRLAQKCSLRSSPFLTAAFLWSIVLLRYALVVFYPFCITFLWWILSPWAMTICLFTSLPPPRPFLLPCHLRSLLECGFGVPS